MHKYICVEVRFTSNTQLPIGQFVLATYFKCDPDSKRLIDIFYAFNSFRIQKYRWTGSVVKCSVYMWCLQNSFENKHSMAWKVIGLHLHLFIQLESRVIFPTVFPKSSQISRPPLQCRMQNEKTKSVRSIARFVPNYCSRFKEKWFIQVYSQRELRLISIRQRESLFLHVLCWRLYLEFYQSDRKTMLKLFSTNHLISTAGHVTTILNWMTAWRSFFSLSGMG